VDAEAAVHRRAVDAEEDAVGDRRPGWVLGVAIEAHLHARATVTMGNGEKITHTQTRDGTHTEREKARFSISKPQPNKSPTRRTIPYLVVRFGAELAEDGVLICGGLRRRHGAHRNQSDRSNRIEVSNGRNRSGLGSLCPVLDRWMGRPIDRRGREGERWPGGRGWNKGKGGGEEEEEGMLGEVDGAAPLRLRLPLRACVRGVFSCQMQSKASGAVDFPVMT
jgi:hypothetical protein